MVVFGESGQGVPGDLVGSTCLEPSLVLSRKRFPCLGIGFKRRQLHVIAVERHHPLVRLCHLSGEAVSLADHRRTGNRRWFTGHRSTPAAVAWPPVMLARIHRGAIVAPALVPATLHTPRSRLPRRP